VQQFHQSIDNGKHAILNATNTNPSAARESSCPVAGMNAIDCDGNNNTGNDNDDCLIVDSSFEAINDEESTDINAWNKKVDTMNTNFVDIVAEEGYIWFGKFVFIVFGPAREKIHYSPTLALGSASESLSERKAGARAALRKNALE
jgi:hypothetical protein